jgi:hypothetical protein
LFISVYIRCVCMSGLFRLVVWGVCVCISVSFWGRFQFRLRPHVLFPSVHYEIVGPIKHSKQFLRTRLLFVAAYPRPPLRLWPPLHPPSWALTLWPSPSGPLYFYGRLYPVLSRAFYGRLYPSTPSSPRRGIKRPLDHIDSSNPRPSRHRGVQPLLNSLAEEVLRRELAPISWQPWPLTAHANVSAPAHSHPKIPKMLDQTLQQQLQQQLLKQMLLQGLVNNICLSKYRCKVWWTTFA